MPTKIQSSKNQVLIPKSRCWGPDTLLEGHDTSEGVLLRLAALRQKLAFPDGLAAIRRRVAYAGPVRSLAEMDAELLRQAALGAPAPVPAATAARKRAR